MSLEGRLKSPTGKRAYARVFRRGEVYAPARPQDAASVQLGGYSRREFADISLAKLLIGLHGQTPWQREDIARAIEREFGLPQRQLKYIPYAVLTCPKSEEAAIQARLNRMVDRVSRTESSSLIGLPELPRRPAPGAVIRTWNLAQIGAHRTRDCYGGTGVRVGAIDSGADYAHPEISARFADPIGYNFVANTADPRDGNGHGSHVCGIIAGEKIGVAPNCTLYAVKVLDDRGIGYTSDLVAGLEWCIDHDADIINMSLGSPRHSQAQYLACQVARKRGITIVAAAGNSGLRRDEYPAHEEGVLAVAAVDRKGRHAPFSTRSLANDIAAPGVEILSCVPGGYALFSGTSMAAPHVTGALAAYKGRRRLGPLALESALKSAAEKLGDLNDPENWAKYGAGLVRIDQMVEAALPAFAGAGRW